VNELESLISARVPDTSTWLITQGFVNVQQDYYWASTKGNAERGSALDTGQPSR
jgi:hypothetical protein